MSHKLFKFANIFFVSHFVMPKCVSFKEKNLEVWNWFTKCVALKNSFQVRRQNCVKPTLAKCSVAFFSRHDDHHLPNRCKRIFILIFSFTKKPMAKFDSMISFFCCMRPSKCLIACSVIWNGFHIFKIKGVEINTSSAT